jgi:5S rRNA maturation endonuclease (ribonuclease M5)
MGLAASMPTAYDRVIDALRDRVPSVKDNGTKATANCPAHPDQHPSLGVTRIEGSVLICCRSQQCHIDDILAAIGLTKRDLFDEPTGATYTYTDLNGTITRQVHRTPDKKFRQSGDTRGKPQLYRLPQVAEAVAAGRPVYVVEGEKDVHALEALGAVATTSPQGSGNWHHVDHAPLAGAHVIVIPDRDSAGHAYASSVIASLRPIAASIELRLPAVGKDAADHVAAGHDLDDLEARPLLEVVPEDDDAPEGGGIAYVDFLEMFTKPREPVRWFASPVAAAGRVTLLYSPGKTGKSLIAMEVAVAAATGMPVLGSPAQEPVQVLYIDQEMTQDDWQDRLEDMGYGEGDAAILNERLHLAQLQAWPPMDTYLGGVCVLQEQQRWAAQLVVIDTASKVIKGEENANDTHGAFYRSTIVPLKRVGCSVVVLDHTGKDVEKGARGGSAKTDNVDLAFELLTRGTDLLSLRCSHARFRDDALEHPTFIRRELSPLRHVIEEHREAGTTPGAMRPTHLMERVSRYIENNPNMSKNAILTAVSGKKEYKSLAIDVLVAEGYVHMQKVGAQQQGYTSLAPYRDEAK